MMPKKHDKFLKRKKRLLKILSAGELILPNPEKRIIIFFGSKIESKNAIFLSAKMNRTHLIFLTFFLILLVHIEKVVSKAVIKTLATYYQCRNPKIALGEDGILYATCYAGNNNTVISINPDNGSISTLASYLQGDDHSGI
jgi:hypothetical protein